MRKILFLVIVLPCPAAYAEQDGEPPGVELQREIALWQSRKDLCDALREPLKKFLIDKDVKEGSLFQPSHIETRMRKIQEQHGAPAGRRSGEAQELAAYHAAAAEFFNVLVQIRDVAKQRLAAREKADAKRTNRPPQRTAAPFVRSSFGVDCSVPRFNHDVAAWQRGLESQARTSFTAGCIGATMADLEGSLRESWTQVELKLRAASDRLIPPLLADGYVRAFENDKLIQKWTRLEVQEAPSILLAECRDPLKIREVKYEIIDAFGTTRFGSVAVFQNAQSVWVPSKDNESRGGFYALNASETSR